MADSIQYRREPSDDPDDLDIIATIGGIRIGHALCTRTGDRLRVGDLRIDQQQHRGHGYGSGLLRKLLQEADADGVREVWGIVTAKDLGSFPGLLEWYRRHGFTDQEPDGECLPTAVRKIVRRIDRA